MQLENEAKKLVDKIDSLRLKIPKRKPPQRHVGAIITDAVLQVGHRWKTQVSPRIRDIIVEYPEANTISGLSDLLKTRGAKQILNWSGEDEMERFRQTVEFFQNEKIETFDDLRKWLKSNVNRDRLITTNARSDKAGIPKIGKATADYYRVLVGVPEAVKVDSRVKTFLIKKAGVTARKYEELRTIVQIAARYLGKRPIDLDSAIWKYQGKGKDKGAEMAAKIKKASQIRAQWMKDAGQFCLRNGLQNECQIIGDMDWPTNWHLKNGGNGGKPSWWFDKRAVKANFLRLWESKSISAKPNGWKDPYRRYEALDEYLKTREGTNWKNKNQPGWLGGSPMVSAIANVPSSPPSEAITINLLTEQKNKIQKFAAECGIDIATLIRLWTLERLHRLC